MSVQSERAKLVLAEPWQHPVLRDVMTKLVEDVERMEKWVTDLQSGMYINCVYCGHQYGPGETTPVSMADALKAHVERCPEHPMSKLAAENAKLEDVNTELRAALTHVRGAIASLDEQALGGNDASHPEEERYSFRDELLAHIDAAVSYLPEGESKIIAPKRLLQFRERLNVVGEFLCGLTDDAEAREAYAAVLYVQSSLKLDAEGFGMDHAYAVSTPEGK